MPEGYNTLQPTEITTALNTAEDSRMMDNHEREVRKAAVQFLESKKNDRALDHDGDNSLDQEYEALIKQLKNEIARTEKSWNTLEFFASRSDVIDNIRARILQASQEAVASAQRKKQKQEYENHHRQAVENSIEKTYTSAVEEKKGVYTMNKWVNKPRIDQTFDITQFLGKVMKINYSQCTNPAITNKVTSQLSQGGQHWLAAQALKQMIAKKELFITPWRDDQDHDTMVVCDANGNPTTQRALIWEGVTMTVNGPTMIDIQETPKESPLNRYPSLKKLTTPQKEKIVDITQKEISTLVSRCINQWISPYDLNDSFDKAWIGNSLMSFNGVNKDGDDISLNFLSSSSIDENIYDILDSNEDDYLSYITDVFRQKWSQRHDTAAFQQRWDTEQIWTWEWWETLATTKRQEIWSMLNTYKKYLQNLAYAESSWSDDDEKMMSHITTIEDIIWRIQTTELTQDHVNALISQALNLPVHMANESSPEYKDASIALEQALQKGDKNSFVKTLRILDDQDNDMSKQSTHVRDLIEGDTELLDITDWEVKTIMKTIDTEIGDDPDQFLQILSKDELQAKLYSFLGDNELSTKVINTCIDDMRDRVQALQKKMEHIADKKHTINTMLAEHQKRYNELVADADSLSPDQRRQLHISEYILANRRNSEVREFLQTAADTALLAMKTVMLQWAMKPILMETLIHERSDGFGWSALDVYKDIVWVGIWDFSDTTINTSLEVAWMVLEEVAIAVVAMALGAMTWWAATAAIYGARVAAAWVKTVRFANKVLKVTKLRKLQKMASVANRLGRGANNLAKSSRIISAESSLGKAFVNNLVSAGTYTTIREAYHGKLWDMSAKEFAAEVTKWFGMFGSLKVAGRIIKGHRFVQVMQRVALEEAWMFSTDLLVNNMQGKKMSPQEVAQNIWVGLVFELFGAKILQRRWWWKIRVEHTWKVHEWTPWEVLWEMAHDPRIGRQLSLMFESPPTPTSKKTETHPSSETRSDVSRDSEVSERVSTTPESIVYGNTAPTEKPEIWKRKKLMKRIEDGIQHCHETARNLEHMIENGHNWTKMQILSDNNQKELWRWVIAKNIIWGLYRLKTYISSVSDSQRMQHILWSLSKRWSTATSWSMIDIVWRFLSDIRSRISPNGRTIVDSLMKKLSRLKTQEKVQKEYTGKWWSDSLKPLFEEWLLQDKIYLFTDWFENHYKCRKGKDWLYGYECNAGGYPRWSIYRLSLDGTSLKKHDEWHARIVGLYNDNFLDLDDAMLKQIDDVSPTMHHIDEKPVDRQPKQKDSQKNSDQTSSERQSQQNESVNTDNAKFQLDGWMSRYSGEKINNLYHLSQTAFSDNHLWWVLDFFPRYDKRNKDSIEIIADAVWDISLGELVRKRWVDNIDNIMQLDSHVLLSKIPDLQTEWKLLSLRWAEIIVSNKTLQEYKNIMATFWIADSLLWSWNMITMLQDSSFCKYITYNRNLLPDKPRLVDIQKCYERYYLSFYAKKIDKVHVYQQQAWEKKLGTIWWWDIYISQKTLDNTEISKLPFTHYDPIFSEASDYKKTKELIITTSILWSHSADRWNSETRTWSIQEISKKLSEQNIDWFNSVFDVFDNVQLWEFKGFGWESFYTILWDWNHRVSAAKLAWCSHVLAEVKQIWGAGRVGTKDEALMAERRYRIEKWYIDGNITHNDDWTYTLTIRKSLFDGCHLNKSDLLTYINNYKDMYGSIPEQYMAPINDMLWVDDI